MRVIAGEYKGRPLKTLNGQLTRPTSDKIKGAIFNRIGPYFSEGKVLDLFSGSGSLAIECISRGMSHAYCVDSNYQAIQIIRDNIALTKEPEKFSTYKMEAEKAIKKFYEEQQKFDFIFLDPPYAEEKIIHLLQQFRQYQLCNPHCQVICETDKAVELPNEIDGFICIKNQLYGRTQISIYRKEE